MLKITRSEYMRREPALQHVPGVSPDPGLNTQPSDQGGTGLRPDPNADSRIRPTRVSPRRDPAPSKVAYRLQRLWLTPLFRSLLRVGVPAFATAMLAGVYLSDQNKADAMVMWFSDLRTSIQERPEFMLQSMVIDGASKNLADDIREVVSVDFPISSFSVDLRNMRATIEELDAVAGAEVRVRSGGLLQVTVKERLPVVVWRTPRGYELLDPKGRLVAETDSRAGLGDLPLVAGDGADRNIGEAMTISAAAAPLGSRVIGLMRMGDRRWDVVLDRDQRIMLPEKSPVAALERVIALDQAQDLLARDLSVVDMRNAERPTIRLADSAMGELQKLISLERGER